MSNLTLLETIESEKPYNYNEYRSISKAPQSWSYVWK